MLFSSKKCPCKGSMWVKMYDENQYSSDIKMPNRWAVEVISITIRKIRVDNIYLETTQNLLSSLSQ